MDRSDRGAPTGCCVMERVKVVKVVRRLRHMKEGEKQVSRLSPIDSIAAFIIDRFISVRLNRDYDVLLTSQCYLHLICIESVL